MLIFKKILSFVIKAISQRPLNSFTIKADRLSKKILEIDNELGRSRMMPTIACQKLLILAEDKRAWKHCGFDIIAIIRSVILTASGKPHGGSTILQQLIRTLTGKYERTIKRKISEIFLSYLVAKRVKRSVYPRVYLSIAYYNTGLDNYDKLIKFKKITMRDDLESAAIVVARLKYPEPTNLSAFKNELILNREFFLLEKYFSLKDKRIFSHVEAI